MTERRLEWDWYDAPLPENLSFGERTWIYSSFAFLHHRSESDDALRIGSDTGIYHQTFFETGPSGRISIGAFGAIAGPILATNGSIAIGDYAFISYGVVIADTFAHVPPQRPERPTVGLIAPTPGRSSEEIVIGDNVWIGARATVLDGARIGEGAVLGALSVVDFDVPPFSIVAGNPARVVGKAA